MCGFGSVRLQGFSFDPVCGGRFLTKNTACAMTAWQGPEISKFVNITGSHCASQIMVNSLVQGCCAGSGLPRMHLQDATRKEVWRGKTVGF